MKSELGDAAIDELRRAFKGAVWRPGDAGFVRHSQLFNATIRSPAQLLVRPLDVDDVSEVVRFCVKHDLSLSVKSGGYGTHGWAVEGDVVVDMRLIAQITIERPMEHSEQDWVSMRESPHVAVKDPDSLKGKARVPSANAYPTSYPSAGVGPQPIHAPFGDSPYRRSADEAFDNVVVVPPDGMDADDRSDPDSDRPTRRLRISSPASHASHASNTPPTTNSPHTPADGSEPKPSNTPKPFSFDDPPSKAIPSTREDVEHDEGMLPPTADRPGAGVDIRGYVGRDVGGWDTVWTGPSEGAAAESVGATYTIAMGDTTAPPTLPPRSTAPLSARPFDFGEASPAMQVNALANPHGNPSLGARPFLPRSNSASNSDYSTPGPESEQPAPTVTHVAFEPTAPVPYTYVTFGAGASQKDVDAFCAAHPLAAVTAGNLTADGVDGVDRVDGVDGIDGHSDDGRPAKKPTVVADSSQPGLYQTPQGSGFGPGSGSFFAPGVGIAAGGAHGYGSVGFGQPSTFASPGHSFFGQPPNPIFGNASTTPTIPYHVPFAAHPVGSTVMLLGGFGFLSRLRGLSMDCLVEAEVVLADGRVVWVSKGGVRDRDGNEVEVGDDQELDEVAKEFVEAEKERAKRAKEKERASDDDESDGEFVSDEKPQVDGKVEEEEPVKKGLWWALRGAGSAFGIVVRYKARAFPIPVVFAGNLIYNFNKSTAASLIKHFRDCIKAAPRELYANCILTSGPKGRGALIVIQICYAGSRADGLPFLQAISSWDVEPCLLNEVQEKEFVWQQDSIAKVLKGGSGRKWFIRSDLISSLTDEIIHRTVRKFSDTPDGCTWLFELSGGALTDTTDSCLPKKAREAAFTIVALHQWRLELDDPACVLTAEQVRLQFITQPTPDPAEKWIKDTLMPQSTGGPFPCFLERRERRSRVLGVYGPENWARLCALKKKYDPTGLFKHNFWPLDEHGRPVLDPREMRNGADVTSGHVMDETLDDRGVPI